jgi:hypothetical protein
MDDPMDESMANHLVDRVVRAPHTGNHTLFLQGPAGAGKTTLVVQRLLHLLERGVPAETILVLVPQRTLAEPYLVALRSPTAPPGGAVDLVTIGGIARRALDLFWPLVPPAAGFDVTQRPRFLTLETAQYYMDRVVEPFLAQGAFDGVTIARPRLASQLLDNLNKAAAVGFSPEEIAHRLDSAWTGESARRQVYEAAQAVALEFWRHCRVHNLLDFSLQLETFQRHLLPRPEVRRYLLAGYRHLLVDNPEEDVPAAHMLLRDWLRRVDSALLASDDHGGIRVFLGADPEGALSLRERCRETVVLRTSHVTSPAMEALGAAMTQQGRPIPVDPRPALRYPEPEIPRFHPQMLDWVADEVDKLVKLDAVPAGEIAVLAPFLSDALRFALTERLNRYGLRVRTHRPSRELREEPAARCLLTLARLAHPRWRRPPPQSDVAHTLSMTIDTLDPVRAYLLARIVYRVRDGQPALSGFDQIVPDMQERITYLLGGRYDELRRWLETYQAEDTSEPLDFFLSRLFGEVLSQPGFGFHHDLDAGAVAANLIESVQKFRRVLPPLSGEGRVLPPLSGEEGQADLGLEYVNLVERGVLAAQYVSSWQIRPGDAVLVVPAYTFLMMNQPVTAQFWLDAGSTAWWERIYQPLTHPYVLRRDWETGQPWLDEDEVRVRQETLDRLLLGLTRRCRRWIYLGISDLSEQGYEQQGPVLRAVQRMLRRDASSGFRPS